MNMNVNAIEPVSSPITQSAAATAPAKTPPARAPKAAPAPAATVASLSTPAATVSTTSVPATVPAQDRALYLQILKSVGGNVSLALAALAATEAKATQS
jgi:hypothetical protein